MICQNCGSNVMDGTAVCPNCGMMIPAPGGYMPQQPQAPYGNNMGGYPQQNPYQQNPYQQQPQYGGGMGGFDPAEKEIKTAKTLGIVAICVGTLCIPLVGWICGGIGLSKASKAPDYLADQAKTAKILNIIGIIGSSLNSLLGVIIMIASNNS